MALRIVVADDHDIISPRAQAAADRACLLGSVCRSQDRQGSGHRRGAVAPRHRCDGYQHARPEWSRGRAAHQESSSSNRDFDSNASLFGSTGARNRRGRRPRVHHEKSDADKDLVAAVEALSNHRSFFTARAADMLLDGFSRPHAAPDPQALLRSRLTSREREIVQLLAEGKSSKEVAVALGISVKTAETHRANIMRKLELHSVSELVRYAVRNQIIEA